MWEDRNVLPLLHDILDDVEYGLAGPPVDPVDKGLGVALMGEDPDGRDDHHIGVFLGEVPKGNSDFYVFVDHKILLWVNEDFVED